MEQVTTNDIQAATAKVVTGSLGKPVTDYARPKTHTRSSDQPQIGKVRPVLLFAVVTQSWP